jgi:oligoribonuclease NrnB/cAMP/cGMP phosphodiesterase (DHH superfamily)
MKFVANDLRVIDHHKTAMEDCRDLDFCIFNMERSGAGMAWEYFFYDEPCPDWILRIEDRDLWKFVYPDTKTIQAYISSLPLTFENWDELNNTPIETMVKNGKAIERYIESYCERAAQEARKIEWPPGVRGVTVNVPYQAASEMASYLLTQHKDCVFSMGWFQRGDGKVQFSLRSRGDYDVSEVAKMVGGGGHRSAAGFALPLGEALDILSRKAT